MLPKFLNDPGDQLFHKYLSYPYIDSKKYSPSCVMLELREASPDQVESLWIANFDRTIAPGGLD